MSSDGVTNRYFSKDAVFLILEVGDDCFCHVEHSVAVDVNLYVETGDRPIALAAHCVDRTGRDQYKTCEDIQLYSKHGNTLSH